MFQPFGVPESLTKARRTFWGFPKRAGEAAIDGLDRFDPSEFSLANGLDDSMATLHGNM